MAAGVEANIFAALSARLSLLTFTPALPIAWPNVTFPAAGQQMPNAYLEVTFLPNRTTTRTLAASGSQQHRGILQVTVHTSTKDSVGITKQLERADRVIEHFPLGLKLFQAGIGVKIYRKPYGIPMPPKDGWLSIPVTIEYETYQP